MTIVQTIEVPNPHNAALLAGAILAADKGVGNRVEETPAGWMMIADDDKAILFTEATQ
jgi:phosphoribosylcarboxyaminoimidazole (NCAIR) mutase